MEKPDFGPLSVNEAKVLYHLVRYPEFSDKEVLGMIDMKQSTYSTIKKKLWKDGFYYTSYTPMLNNLGSELMVIWYVTLNRKTRTEDRLAITRDALLNASDVFTIVSESNQAILVSVSKNIADHVRVSDELIQLYEEHDFLEDVHFVYYPFEVSSLFSFFDFVPLLNRMFKMEPEKEIIKHMYDLCECAGDM